MQTAAMKTGCAVSTMPRGFFIKKFHPITTHHIFRIFAVCYNDTNGGIAGKCCNKDRPGVDHERRKTMKKSISLLLAVMLVCMMSLVGCGGEDQSEAVKSTADSFLTAMNEGNTEEMQKYCDEKVLTTGALSAFKDFNDLESALLSGAGIEEGALTDEAKASLDEFKTNFLNKLIESYELGEPSIGDDGTATIEATINFGYDVNRMSTIDMSKIDGAEEIVTEYMTAHQSELMEIYQKDGQDKVLMEVMNAVLPDLLDLVTKAIDEQCEGTMTETDTLTLTQQDDGSWLITDMQVKSD